MRRSAILLWLALAAACDPLDDERDELRAAEERWQDAAIDSYSFTLHWACYCPSSGAFAIVVEDDTIASAERVRDDGWETDTIPALTVPQMFARIRQTLDQEPDDATLRFARLGYPVSVGFDMIENAVDDEWGFSVTDFVATPAE